MMKVGKEGWERTGGKSWGPKETMRPPNKKEGPDCLTLVTKCSHEAGARVGATHRSPDNPASAREGKGETGTIRGRPTEQRAERGGLAGWQAGQGRLDGHLGTVVVT